MVVVDLMKTANGVIFW